MSHAWFVYVLKEPYADLVRYVGITRSPRRRLAEHSKKHLDNSARTRWINALIDLGSLPLMEIIDNGAGAGDGDKAEKKWIAHYRNLGASLVNMTDGGNGTAGYAFTDEARQKISQSTKGKRHSSEWIRHSAASHRALGRKVSSRQKEMLAKFHSGRSFMSPEGRKRVVEWAHGRQVKEETRAKLSAAFRGRPVSPQTRALLAKANIGKNHSEVTREKLSALRKGIPKSLEHRRKLADKTRDQWQSPEHRALISAKLRESWAMRKRKR